MTCDDIAEPLLVLPHWKLQPLLQDLVVARRVRQVGEWVDLLVHGHLLEGQQAWLGRRAVRRDTRRLRVSVPVSVPVPVSISVPVPGAVLTLSVAVPVSPVNIRAGHHYKYFQCKRNYYEATLFLPILVSE